MNPSSDSTIHALLRLLSDPDQQVAQTIQHEFVRLGSSTIPFLEQAAEKDPVLEPRVAYVKDEIRFEQLKEEFRTFVSHSARQGDWEQGAFLIAKLSDPDLPIPHYVDYLNQLAEEFRAKWLSPTSPPGKASRLLNTFLFKDKGFSGNKIHYYDPDNSYLHRVIETRQGIPITLSAIYVFVGNRLDLPLAGVGMPGHFLVKIEGESPVQFVDCFNGGTVLLEQDCQKFLTASGIDYQPHFLEKSSTKQILTRMLRNLLSIYEREEQHCMGRRVQTLLDVFEQTS